MNNAKQSQSVWRRFGPPILKIGVTLVGLLIVLARFDPAAIWKTITGADLGWLIISFLLMIVSLFVRAYRWQIILQGIGGAIPYGRLVELYFVGAFFNSFLPSGLGGDIVRAAEAAQNVTPSDAVGSVAVDRLTGLLALFAMALAVLPFRPADFPEPLLLLVVSTSTVGLLAGLLVIDGRLVRRVFDLLPQRFQQVGGGVVEGVLESIDSCGWRHLLAALGISVIFNLIQVAWWYTTGKALHLEVPYTYYLLVVPFMSLALLVPSIGGLGVRETLAPGIFAGAGVLPEQAVSLTILVFALERLTSLLGAPVYILTTIRETRKRRQTDKITNAPEH